MTTMRPEAILTAAIAVTISVAVVLGLIATGGLTSGRQERRDEIRLRDMRQISRFVKCVAKLDEGTPPDVLAPNPACGSDPAFADPVTGAPYVYEKISDISYRLCATYERPDLVLDQLKVIFRSFDQDTGCGIKVLNL